MNPSTTTAILPVRSQRLLEFLKQDPTNAQLLQDTAMAAFDDGDLALTSVLIGRCAALQPLSPAMANLAGLVAIRDRRFTEAAEVFETLLAHNPDDAALRFNLAWSRALTGDFESAVRVLDEGTTTSLPRAAALKVQSLHNLGRLDEALAFGPELVRAHPNDEGLMGALAVAAIDAENIELAKAYAEKAGDTHEGLSTLGMLELNDSDVEASLRLFERALANHPDSARSLLGMGLGLMAKGESGIAASYIDRSAEVFRDHLGSWVAAGWAYFAAGDYGTSRARFEAALALDDTFAESHGGLAVLAITEGHFEEARRRTEVALRLDRNCLAGALAKSLLLMHDGDQRSAERIQSIALNMPIGPGGKTIAEAAIKFGLASPKKP